MTARVVIVRPVYGPLDYEVERCVDRLRRAEPQWELAEVAGNSMVDRARSAICEAVLAFDPPPVPDVLLWLDTDIEFEVEDARSIVRQAFDLQALVGGVYVQKAPPHNLCIRAFDEGEHALTSVRFFKHGRLLPVRGIGFGFVAMPRTVLEQMEIPKTGKVRHWFLPMVDERGEKLLGEDFSFCERARRSGFRVFADTRVRIFHVGRKRWAVEDAGLAVPRVDDLTVETWKEEE